MEAATHKKNHVASKCYLDAFADDSGFVSVLRRATGQVHPARPGSVGYRNHFWGRDARVRAQAEERMSQVETVIGPVLPNLHLRWPLQRASEEWWALVTFMAIHVARTPVYRAHVHRVSEQSLAEGIAEQRAELGPEVVEQLERHFRRDVERANALLRMIPKLASLLGSMHFTLLTFEAPLLMTSDQPVAPVPLAPDAPAIAAVPTTGYLNTLEFRFPVNPWAALILTWIDEDDELLPVAGTYAQACSLNLSSARQADQEMFFRGGGARPPILAPPLAEPEAMTISPLLFPGYGLNAVRTSKRRDRADEIISEMVERQDHDRITVASVRRRAPKQIGAAK